MIEGRTLDGERVVLRATVATSRARDSVSNIQIPQQGSEGVYKGVAWAVSEFSGVRIKRGPERDEALRDARILEEADWRSLYPKSRLLGIETIGSESCYKIQLLPSGTTEWFSLSTGLLVRRTSSEISADGDTPTGYTVEQWGEHDGIKQPRVMLAWRGDLEYRLTVLSIAYNAERGRDDFKYPAPVAEYLAADHTGKALPNAEEIIERHIYESGGPEAYEMLRTQKITGTLTFVARNIEGRMETWAAGGGRYYQSTDIPGMGKQEEGSDGVIAWDRSPSIGPRVRPRKNSGAIGITLDAAGMIAWRVLIDRVRTEAEERVDGRDCYRVRLVPRDGSPDMIRWYDRDTGLLYRSSLATRTDMGELPVVLTFEEYREIAGVRWPSRIRTTASGQDTVFAADEVKLNEPVDDAVFDVPPEIRELAQKRAIE
jgi:Outer membrane lipoprotein-sorting protein